MDDRYPLVGNRYEDQDWRNEGRTLKVISFATDHNAYEIPGWYRVEVITAPLNPGTVGRRYKINGATLLNERRYRELTHT